MRLQYQVFCVWCFDSCRHHCEYILRNRRTRNEFYDNIFFPKIKDDGIYLYQESLQDYTRKKTVTDTNKTLRSHHFVGGGSIEISGWFFIHNCL